MLCDSIAGHIGKNTVSKGPGTTYGFRHLLGILDPTPHRQGTYCIVFQQHQTPCFSLRYHPSGYLDQGSYIFPLTKEATIFYLIVYLQYGDQTQVLMHARQVLYHCVPAPAQEYS
jgi:hypothetical protein